MTIGLQLALAGGAWSVWAWRCCCGEVKVTSDDIREIAVHTPARILAVAAPGEILVSATVLDLVDGSGLAFEDAGHHELKGISGRDSAIGWPDRVLVLRRAL
jgi:class 3 adenylate cyclase